jgi:hypothetical protein
MIGLPVLCASYHTQPRLENNKTRQDEMIHFSKYNLSMLLPFCDSLDVCIWFAIHVLTLKYCKPLVYRKINNGERDGAAMQAISRAVVS